MRTALSTVISTAAMALLVGGTQEVNAQEVNAQGIPAARAAEEYRDAVKRFGQFVVEDHRLTRAERRVAPPLVDAAIRFHALAKNRKHHHRLTEAWNSIELMHERIEAILFARPGSPVWVELRPIWQRVLLAQGELTRELVLIRVYRPYRRYRVIYYPANLYPRRRQPAPAEPKVQPNYRYPSPVVTSYRYRDQKYVMKRAEPAKPSQAHIAKVRANIERAKARPRPDLRYTNAAPKSSE